MSRIIALVPAAGMGKRMEAGSNKQYLLLDGVPIVARTLQVFQQAAFVDAIYLVIPEAEITYCRKEVVEAYDLSKVVAIVPGGAERQNSVFNGLRAMEDVAPDDIVLIHDGVRPFLSEQMLLDSAAAAREAGAAVVAVPVKDTVKVVREGSIAETPAREQLWLAQTPQAFRYGVIRSAHEKAEAEGFLGTDDASLVERQGGEVRVVRGDYRNIKITTPEDMLLAAAFLKERD